MQGDSELKLRYRSLLDKIREACLEEGRSELPVLVAVSKTQPVEKILELYQLGQRDFGENYVQELLSKAEWAKNAGLCEIRWHLIGHLQRNKVKLVLSSLHAFHALDSVPLAQELILRKRALEGRKLQVFVQVNTDAEASKRGVSFAHAKGLIDDLGGLKGAGDVFELTGLMCIPDPRGDVSKSFERLQGLTAELGDRTLGKLSMGMSDDFCLAIGKGATHLRVGSALFGPRTP